MKSTWLTMLAFMVAGCAAQGSDYFDTPVAPTESAVVVYRPYHSAGGILKPAVTCGDTSADIGPGGFHKFITKPGAVECSVHTEVTTSVNIYPQPGQTYYVRESLWPGFLVAHVHLDPKEADEAAAELQDCKEQ